MDKMFHRQNPVKLLYWILNISEHIFMLYISDFIYLAFYLFSIKYRGWICFANKGLSPSDARL